MKKLIFFVSILVVHLNCFAQPYIKLGVGAARTFGFFNLGEQMFGSRYQMGTAQFIYGSFGEGSFVNAALGYALNRSVAVELGNTYHFGVTFTSFSAPELSDTARSYLTESKGKYFGLLPSIVVTASGMKTIQLYAKASGIIAFPHTRYVETITGSGAPSGNNVWEESGNLAFGLQGALGVSADFGMKSLSFYGEIFGIDMNWGPDERENTETFNGQTTRPTVKYKESYNASEQNVSPQPRIPFSGFGVNVGVSYYFGKRK